ncbi:hypothetical protein L2E82_11770 [Cichorium intybus]|uniref:Uncharacterized protein n=1 Tax=Cichorium intybus TaxID=13427 RepID=A0ACB9GEV2_CICIN|nr:hypothetical protein L2E82_11770 [Cichorium intybus]
MSLISAFQFKFDYDYLHYSSIVISIQKFDCLSVIVYWWLGKCFVGEIKYIELLHKCFATFHASGLGDSSIKFLGGLNVFLQLKTEMVVQGLLRRSKGWMVQMVCDTFEDINNEEDAFEVQEEDE